MTGFRSWYEDNDFFRGVERLITRLRDHHGKNLADIFRFTNGHRGLRAGNGRISLLDRRVRIGFLGDRSDFPWNPANAVSLQIRTRQDRDDTRGSLCSRRVYIIKVGARDFRADEHGVRFARDADVVEEPVGSAQKFIVFEPRNGFTD